MFPLSAPPPAPEETQIDRWHSQAEADYALCRRLADQCGARCHGRCAFSASAGRKPAMLPTAS